MPLPRKSKSTLTVTQKEDATDSVELKEESPIETSAAAHPHAGSTDLFETVKIGCGVYLLSKGVFTLIQCHRHQNPTQFLV